MRRGIAVLALLSIAALASARTGRAGDAPAGVPAPAEEPLPEDALVAVRIEKGVARWDRPFDVPEGATRLAAIVSSHQDVNVYLRRLEPVGADLSGAVVRSDGPDGEERAEVAPVEAGRWWVTVVHPASARGGASFDVLALLDGGERPPLVLNGGAAAFDVRHGKTPFRFRTLLPRAAVSLAVAADAHAVLTLRGPGGALATAEDALVVRRGAAGPAGVWVGEVEPPGTGKRASGKVTVRVEVPSAPKAGEERALEAGVEEEIRLGGKEGSSTQGFVVVVPEGSPGVQVSCLADEGGDVDLYARRGGPMDDDAVEAAYLGMTTGPEETLVLSGEGGLPAGTYRVKAVAVEGDDAHGATLLLSWLAKPGVPASWGNGPPPRLEPARWVSGAITSKESAFRWWTVEAPRGAATARVQVVGASSATDLVAADPATGGVVARSITDRVDESMEVEFTGEKAVPRRFLLGVVNRSYGEDRVEFRVAVGFNGAPALPDDLRFPPFHVGQELNDAERVAEAVVEVSAKSGGGSGVCVTPGGLLISCRHVFEGETKSDPLQVEQILVAFPDDFRRPPRQLYVARVVESDADLDLALLQLVADVYGRPLPADLRLPSVPLGDSEALRLGDPLTTIGYPESGSEHSRTSVIVSRGVVSGLEADAGGLAWIKTDAWIASGHSGGAVVSGSYRLVGIASATLGDGRTFGLVRPAGRLPPAWRLRISEGSKK